MNFNQLTVFREVMETGSISQTAKNLGRTQPAISLTIKNLERALDLSLFERRGRRLIPVPEAQYLLNEAVEVLDRLSTVSGTMKGLKAAQTGSLNIAAMPGPSAYIFPRFISENVSHDSNFKTTISSRSSAQIRELASTQGIDFGFADVDQPIGKNPQYSSEIIDANCFCALQKGHALAGKSEISISDLEGQSVGTLRDDHALTRKLTQSFEREGVQLNSNIAGQFFLPLIPFISAGHCCSIVDPLTVVTERELNIAKGQVVFLPFAAPIRYEYATLTPLHRPPSQLATRVKEKWIQHVFSRLEDIGAEPAKQNSSC